MDMKKTSSPIQSKSSPRASKSGFWLSVGSFCLSLAALVCSVFCLVRLSGRPAEFPESKTLFTSREAAQFLDMDFRDFQALVNEVYQGEWRLNLGAPVEINGKLYYKRSDLLGLHYYAGK